MKHNGTRAPEAIIADIEQTRSEMDHTLHAIEERLTPGQLVDQGLDYLRKSGGREFLSNLNSSVKANPLPTTLVGIGLLWLMAAGQRGTPAYYSSATSADGLAARAGDLKDQAAETAASARDKIANTAQSARNRVAETAQRTRDTWNRTSDAARQQIDRARSSYQHVLQEQPLALGALGLGLGALIAASAPRTRREDEAMGEAADRLKETIAEAGQEQMKKAREMIASAKQGPSAGSATKPESASPGPDSTAPARAFNTPTGAQSGDSAATANRPAASDSSSAITRSGSTNASDREQPGSPTRVGRLDG